MRRVAQPPFPHQHVFLQSFMLELFPHLASLQEASVGGPGVLQLNVLAACSKLYPAFISELPLALFS